MEFIHKVSLTNDGVSLVRRFRFSLWMSPAWKPGLWLGNSFGVATCTTLIIFRLQTLRTFDFTDFIILPSVIFIIHFRQNGVFRSNVLLAGGLDSSLINPGLKAGAELSRPFRSGLRKNTL